MWHRGATCGKCMERVVHIVLRETSAKLVRVLVWLRLLEQMRHGTVTSHLMELGWLATELRSLTHHRVLTHHVVKVALATLTLVAEVFVSLFDGK